MLAIAVELLTGRYVAAHYLANRHVGDERLDHPPYEWPPHPHRLFCALVAAAYRLGGEAGDLEVLRWLEQQGAPRIAASGIQAGANPLHYTKPNYAPLASGQPRRFPACNPRDARVHFIWPDSEPSLAPRQALERLVRHMTYLGRSHSLVLAWLEEKPPAPNWVPLEGDTYLRPGAELAFIRVPYPGLLAELDYRFEHNLDSSLNPYLVAYALIGEICLPPAAIPGDTLVPFRFVAGPGLRLAMTVPLMERVRRAALALAGDEAPASLHGHRPCRARVTWVPLAHVGHEHARGRLLGYACRLPAALPAEERATIEGVLANMREIDMGPKNCPYVVERVDGLGGRALPYGVRPQRWTYPSKSWATVTPVLLGHHPKRGQLPEDLIRRLCLQRGYPQPDRIEWSRAAFVKGVPACEDYLLRRPGTDPKGPSFHVRLMFDENIAGPLQLGAQQTFGCGLFVPMGDGGHQAP